MGQLELPRRLVDIGTTDTPVVKLVERDMIVQEPDTRYTTLSHCWGGGKGILQTTSSTLSARHLSIAWTALPKTVTRHPMTKSLTVCQDNKQDNKQAKKPQEPVNIPYSKPLLQALVTKTFRDAILVARALNVRYIWIDSLCIIQDSLADWADQASKMADIYRGSYLTLAATSAKNSHEGLLFRRSAHPIRREGRNLARLRVHSVKIQAGDVEVQARNQSTSAHIQLRDFANFPVTANAPLLSRAWCFQERMLSSRVVHFHGEEMLWECAEGTQCECGGLQAMAKVEMDSEENIKRTSKMPLKSQVSQVPNALCTRKEGLDTWLKIVNVYSPLFISKESDRLPALAGLARGFEEVLNCRYLAGLWEADISRNLTWYREPADLVRGFQLVRRQEVPSWSWASVALKTTTGQLIAIKSKPRAPVSHYDNLCRRKSHQTSSRHTKRELESTRKLQDADSNSRACLRAISSVSHHGEEFGFL
ncbi:heterokaryon incompatibility protein-domain-containing protein [Podospora fimiseda]|uniref:Heterokaryon incompatibility protein-domain-containing protein n=1 Tax=Podospora fimiseda TaxID=252190 RepID=A0AAN7GS17_9PEZI|nr:heterokaryon incompatibility protein-domain-containing protein [Podospora fimiseda]